MDKSIDRLDIFDVDLLLSYFFFLTLLLRPCVAAAAEEERGQEWKWENGQLCAWSCALIGPRSAIYPFCLPPSTSSSWPGGRLGERERSNGLVWLATRTQHALTDAAPPTDATPHPPKPLFPPIPKGLFLSFFLSLCVSCCCSGALFVTFLIRVHSACYSHPPSLRREWESLASSLSLLRH